jgi:hypothetical protein
MIETLSGASVAQEPEPDEPQLEITGIYFDQNDLSKPRYPSLIDYGRAPQGVQFEPTIQILQVPVPVLHVLYAIDPQAPVTFEADAGNVKVTSVENPRKPPPGLVSAKLVDGDPRRCEVIWDQDEANRAFGGLKRLSSMRIHCLPTPTRDLSPPEHVEGGVYLAILNRQEVPFQDHFVKDRGQRIWATIKVLGFDEKGRVVYDLFQPGVQDGLPASLTLDPAFRIREGQISSFHMVLDLPPELDRIKFELEPETDAVRVFGFEPEGRPFQLGQTTASSFENRPDRKCEVEWFQETGRQFCATSNPTQAARCYCTQGLASSFALRATPDGKSSEILILAGEADRVAEFDPTVIQPPSCTSGGICITP